MSVVQPMLLWSALILNLPCEGFLGARIIVLCHHTPPSPLILMELIFFKIYVFYVHECFVYVYVYAPCVVFIDDCHHVLSSALNAEPSLPQLPPPPHIY